MQLLKLISVSSAPQQIEPIGQVLRPNLCPNSHAYRKSRWSVLVGSQYKTNRPHIPCPSSCRKFGTALVLIEQFTRFIPVLVEQSGIVWERGHHSPSIFCSRYSSILHPQMAIDVKSAAWRQNNSFGLEPFSVYPRSLANAHLSLGGFHAILSRFRLLLGDGNLPLGSNAGLRRISSSLSSRDIEKVGLVSHFLPLTPKDSCRYEDCDEGSSYEYDVEPRPAKGQALKFLHPAIFYDPCEQRAIHDSYWRYGWFLIFLGACGIVGWWDCDILLEYRRLGGWFEHRLRLLRGRGLSEGERVPIGGLGFLVAILLEVQALIIVARASHPSPKVRRMGRPRRGLCPRETTPPKGWARRLRAGLRAEAAPFPFGAAAGFDERAECLCCLRASLSGNGLRQSGVVFLFSRLPRTSVRGYHLPPLRGWRSAMARLRHRPVQHRVPRLCRIVLQTIPLRSG